MIADMLAAIFVVGVIPAAVVGTGLLALTLVQGWRRK